MNIWKIENDECLIIVEKLSDLSKIQHHFNQIEDKHFDLKYVKDFIFDPERELPFFQKFDHDNKKTDSSY